MKKIRYCRSDKVFYTISGIFLALLLLLVAYPLIYVLSASFSSGNAVSAGRVVLWPVDFSLEGYKAVFNKSDIWPAYLNTILYTVVGTFINVAMVMIAAYPLSRSDLKGRNVVMVLFTFTMFFGGGMIPSYLNIRNLHMINTIWAMILPGAISAWNVIMFVNFFKGIPDSLRESATIDGAGHVRILFSIVIPLSKALLATIALFTIVGFWNDYFSAMLYLDSTSKMPIQIFLRKILVNMELNEGMAKDTDMSRLMDMINANPRTVKAATTIVTILPILCVYPFLQKYFTKGMMLGAVKA